MQAGDELTTEKESSNGRPAIVSTALGRGQRIEIWTHRFDGLDECPDSGHLGKVRKQEHLQLTALEPGFSGNSQTA